MLDNDSPPQPNIPQGNGASDPSAESTRQVSASQRQMINLSKAAPRPCRVTRQHLEYWFKRTIPTVAGDVTVDQLFVRTSQKARLSQSEREPNGQSSRQKKEDVAGLEHFFWRAIAGQVDIRDSFADLDSLEIVVEMDGSKRVPTALNSPAAKKQFQRLLGTTPVAYEQLLMTALDDFWDTPAAFSQGRNVSDWLANELAAQLTALANLHLHDKTLSPPMHKAIMDSLSAPDAASRNQLAEGTRPGVYSLIAAFNDWGLSVPVTSAAVLSRHDADVDWGGAVLYRPGRPLEVYEDSKQLKISFIGDSTADEVELVPLEHNFLTRLVTDVRTTQKAAIRDALSSDVVDGENISGWMHRLDAAADLGMRLDLASALDEREFRLKLKSLHHWLHASPHTIGSDRLAWWQATQALQETLTDMAAPPDPVSMGTAQAIRDQARTLLAGFIKAKYPAADPDDITLSIRKETVDPHAPTGHSPFGSGVSMGSAKAFQDDTRLLTDWAMSNLTDDERQAAHHTVVGPLSFAQIVDVIERADVGARLPAVLQRKARERQTQWMGVKAKHMRAQVWAAHISGDLRHDKDNTGLKLVLAALDRPGSAERGKVNGHEVVVRQLHWGDSVLKDLLAFGVKSFASRPSLTLYTPGAPDGKTFRDVDASGSGRALQTALAQTLTATPEMTRWLISHLPLPEQAAQVAGMLPAEDDLTVQAKIKKVKQSVFKWTRDRTRNDFAFKVTSPVVEGDLLKALHETQITHVLKTVRTLTVSNAERDSAAAREGRRNGVALLTGAMSMVPVGRLGGILGRAILPTLAGGAAVSAIQDEDGSVGQWTSDFIRGLGEVLAEGGQDLIMARATRRRGKAHPALASLPRMPDPQLKPFQLKGFDGKGLLPEGRSLYRDVQGQGYLKLGKDYFKTAFQNGEQVIYTPSNRTDQRAVTWENGQWTVQERQRLLGGGGYFSRDPERAEDRTFNALVEGVLPNGHDLPREVVDMTKRVVRTMPETLAERILKESIDDVGATDVETYRSLMRTVNRQNFARHKAHRKNLANKICIWELVERTNDNLQKGKHFSLTPPQKMRLYETLVKHKDEFTLDHQLKVSTTILPDNVTGAKYIVIVPKTGKKKEAADRIAKDITDTVKYVENSMDAKLDTMFTGDGPAVAAARQAYLDSPEYQAKIIDEFRKERARRHRPGLLTEIRNFKIPYIIVNRGKTQRSAFFTTEEDINNFTRTLENYSPFDIELVTQAASNKVTGQSSASAPAAITPQAPTVIPRYTVTISPLAEAQMSYDNFPGTARVKVMEIMDDLRAGRITTKKINRYYWYDMAQLGFGGGRGAWRAAFERHGDTWTLQGFYDYHATRNATVWGD
ncbi:hypothetical protein M1D68_23210 [Pseudomonas sp. R4-84]